MFVSFILLPVRADSFKRGTCNAQRLLYYKFRNKAKQQKPKEMILIPSVTRN